MTTGREKLTGLIGGLAAGGWSASEKKAQALIGVYRVQQRQLTYRGRSFHFVSYAGKRTNPATGEPGSLATWFLMSAGTRWEVAPQLVGEEAADTDRRLLAWLERTIVEPPGDLPRPTTKKGKRTAIPAWERGAAGGPQFGD